MAKKVWFISDLHFSHKNILKFKNKRCTLIGDKEDEPIEDRLKRHDEYIIRMWNMTINKCDTVYILGDVSFADTESTRRILERLNGHKHLIIGNHDKSCKGLENYFESTSQIKEATFKVHEYPFLHENIHLTMCHYPLLSWNRRMTGAFMVHGHTHGGIDKLNKDSEELRVDVGIDGELSDYKIIDLETLYGHFKSIIDSKGIKTFKEYAEYKASKDGIRF